ncbi:MAG: glycosyltransferase [Bacteroidales bacterium]|nr:glycosyltransferase [Bacteroidales bacterium]
MNPVISVITPIYNVKQYVGKCIDSLMQQTFMDAEYIFVDDASTDGSIEILESIISRYPDKNIKILHHQINRGLPASRKTGFEAATGDYVFNCDGDDYVEETMLEKMYAAVSETDADYAYCDFFLTYATGERYMHCPTYTTPDEALRKGYLGGAMKYNVWNKLIRRSLYAGVVFPVDHRKGGEDMIMLSVLSKAKRIAYVPEALYHYVNINTGAISKGFSEQRLIDVKYNANTAIEYLVNHYPADLTKEIAFFKLNVKLQFIITDDKSRYKIWKDWYPESNAYAMKNKNLPLRTRLIQWCAAHELWSILQIYNFLVYRVLYRLLYR